MDSSNGQSPVFLRGKTKMLVGLSVAVVVAVVLGVSQNMTSVFTGAATDHGKQSKPMDLGVTWTGPSVVSPSDNVTQTADIGNTGPEAVKRFRLSETVPDGFDFVSVQTSDPVTRASCRRTGRGMRCTVTPAGDGIVEGGHLTVILTFRMREPSCGKIYHSDDLVVGTGESDLFDSNPGNDRAPGFDTEVACQ